MHQVEGFVDALQRHGMGDEVVQAEFAFQIALHVFRQLGAAAHAAEGGAAPYPAGDQLERTGGDFLPGAGHADDHRFAPALVAAFQRRAHHLDVADALEGEIDAAVGHFHDHVLDRLVEAIRIDAIGGAQFFSPARTCLH